ncbi:hypothetical protein DL546_004924 [Coniochaeta pulveracea]|uniref:Uncharacterized protein n=1 Tax=Coniochaeta pulveracea TaxID=177199 RepID=A0A420YAP5_9PEZI|nr:hypothetical protein DL546_004924 [Coniochaeta pulveracea]
MAPITTRQSEPLPVGAIIWIALGCSIVGISLIATLVGGIHHILVKRREKARRAAGTKEMNGQVGSELTNVVSVPPSLPPLEMGGPKALSESASQDVTAPGSD